MRDRSQLLGHGKSFLPQPTLLGWDRQVQGVAEVGAGERNGERETQTRLVQLIDRDDYEGTWLCLLSAPRRVGIGPVDLTLLGANAYHSGVGASKPDPISPLSAR